ncbi:MAG: hypothetical protein HOO99_18765 [Hyphomicrobiaceae bacterium]|nr:hypothetical protein [Hyphomicrobiaceae bacterium]
MSSSNANASNSNDPQQITEAQAADLAARLIPDILHDVGEQFFNSWHRPAAMRRKAKTEGNEYPEWIVIAEQMPWRAAAVRLYVRLKSGAPWPIAIGNDAESIICEHLGFCDNLCARGYYALFRQTVRFTRHGEISTKRRWKGGSAQL